MSEFRHALPLEIHSAVDSHGTVKSRHSDVIADGRSKKRRREDDDDGRKKEGGSAYGKLLHKRSFIIKPCPTSVYDKPHTVTPLFLLPRSRLHLSFLDASIGSSALPANRLFGTDIALLDQSSTGEHGTTDSVVIAKVEIDGSLCALEQVQQQIYSLCRLASWVKAEQLQELASSPNIVPSIVRHPVLQDPVTTKYWWSSASTGPLPSKPTSKRESLRVSMIDTTAAPATAFGNHVLAEEQSSTISPYVGDEPTVADDNLEPEPMGASQIFDTLILQYLESLYLSRTSLAYFAKGPLSRARAAFNSGQDDRMTTYELVVLLRTMLLTMASMDKKYRIKLPDTVKDAHLDAMSDSEATWKPTLSAMRGKSKKFKLKLSNDGMYKREEEFAKRWWKFHDNGMPHPGAEETLDGAIKRRIAELRMRETLAQMIIVLEVMALEAAPSYKEPTKLEDDKDDAPLDKETVKEKKKRAKKPQDLKLLLDLLLDKLCIWQSVEQDDFLSSESKAEQTSAANTTKVSNGDALRDFCVEVIIPFYMNRLPERAASVNRKLGGPATGSPSKRRPAKAMQPPKKPGEPASRTEQASKRTLSRVASDTLGKRTSQIQSLSRQGSLSRSDSDTALLSKLIKREPSEAAVSLSSIPPQRSPSRASVVADANARASRAASATYKRFERQSVDFREMERAAVEKKRRKEKIEEELRNAIGTLRKPNRGAAVREFVDESDARNLLARSKAQKRTSNTVQVTATPKRIRHTGVHSQPVSTNLQLPLPDDDLPPPSSVSCIPSSGARGPNPSSAVPSTVTRNYTVDINDLRKTTPAIEETPSRRGLKTVSFFSESHVEPNFAHHPATPLSGKRQSRTFSTLPPVGRQLFQKSATQPSVSTSYPDISSSPPQFDELSNEIPASTSYAVAPPSSQSSEHIFATPIKPSTATFSSTSLFSRNEVPSKRPGPLSNEPNASRMPASSIFEPKNRGILKVRQAIEKQSHRSSSTFSSSGTEVQVATDKGKSKADDSDIFDALGWNDDDEI